jgi:hypothetical protein
MSLKSLVSRRAIHFATSEHIRQRFSASSWACGASQPVECYSDCVPVICTVILSLRHCIFHCVAIHNHGDCSRETNVAIGESHQEQR